MSEDAFLYALTIGLAALAILIAVAGRVHERRAERRRQADRLAMSRPAARAEAPGGAAILPLRPRRG